MTTKRHQNSITHSIMAALKAECCEWCCSALSDANLLQSRIHMKIWNFQSDYLNEYLRYGFRYIFVWKSMINALRHCILFCQRGEFWSRKQRLKIGFFVIFCHSTTFQTLISISKNGPMAAYFLHKTREINKNLI